MARNEGSKKASQTFKPRKENVAGLAGKAILGDGIRHQKQTPDPRYKERYTGAANQPNH